MIRDLGDPSSNYFPYVIYDRLEIENDKSKKFKNFKFE